MMFVPFLTIEISLAATATSTCGISNVSLDDRVPLLMQQTMFMIVKFPVIPRGIVLIVPTAVQEDVGIVFVQIGLLFTQGKLVCLSLRKKLQSSMVEFMELATTMCSC